MVFFTTVTCLKVILDVFASLCMRYELKRVFLVLFFSGFVQPQCGILHHRTTACDTSRHICLSHFVLLWYRLDTLPGVPSVSFN